MKSSKQIDNKQKKWIIGVFIFIVVYSISLFTPVIKAYTMFPLYTLKCMKLPIAASTFAAGNNYTVPGDKAYFIDPFVDRYFCTESEAQAAGFRYYNYITQ